MASSWNKKEREKKKQQARKEKEEKRKERKDNAKKGQSLDDMMAYIDENGNITSTPPDPSRKKIEINAEDIEIGVPKQRELDPEELVHKGIVTFFNEEKGYGFIKDQSTQESIFVHINASQDQLARNSRVSFEIERGPKGLNAVNVKLAG